MNYKQPMAFMFIIESLTLQKLNYFLQNIINSALKI